MAEFHRDWIENTGAGEWTVEEIQEAGEEVLIAVRIAIRPAKGEIEFSAPAIYYVARVRAGRIDRMRVFDRREKALRAMGLQPDASHPTAQD